MEGGWKECTIAMKQHKTLKLGINFLDIFRAQNDHLVVGYLTGKEIFEFWPNLCLWQLFNEGNRQGISANFEKGPKL